MVYLTLVTRKKIHKILASSYKYIIFQSTANYVKIYNIPKWAIHAKNEI